MDLIDELRADLDKGYSKSDLEKLIGLPTNNLSGILKGNRNLSKKSILKIEKWMASEKPDPLNVFFKPKEIKDLNKPTNVIEPQKPMGSEKSNYILRTLKEEPPRLKNESSIEYRLRMIELKEKKDA